MQREEVHILRLRKAHERVKVEEQVQLLFAERSDVGDNAKLLERAKTPINSPVAPQDAEQLPIVLRLQAGTSDKVKVFTASDKLSAQGTAAKQLPGAEESGLQ